MSRFLHNDKVTLPALIEPAQNAIREALATSASPFTLVVHDWSMFAFGTHTTKTDKYKRSSHNDTGYELGSAFVVDAADGRPLGPMEMRLRHMSGSCTTRVGEVVTPPGHVDELLDVFATARSWGLEKKLVHVIDREADSVGHYRTWDFHHHRFLVRADRSRRLLWQKKEHSLSSVVNALHEQFHDVKNAQGQVEVVKIREGTGRVQVAETEVTLHKPAKKTIPGKRTAGGHKCKQSIPGEPLALRLVVTRVVDAFGKILAEWYLLTNLKPHEADSATVGRWYAWRWQIETFHKLLKSSGMNAENWQQKTSEAFLRRLCIAVMSCVTVWHLQRDDSEDAKELRRILVRLSGRQMAYKVLSTAPALLAGLEKLLAILDLLETENLEEILALARRVLPKLFNTT
jgi:Transposase DDE domain